MISPLKIAMLIVCFIFFNMTAYATPYGHYDFDKILKKDKASTDSNYNLDIKQLDVMLKDLVNHALAYPPKFDSAEDKERATMDAFKLIGILNIYIENDPNPRYLVLSRAAMANHIGYTLDIPDTGKRATELYEKLLTIRPENREISYFYGLFLLSSNKCHKSINYFDKAIKGGNVLAQFAEGLAYISCGDKENALRALNAYKKKQPGDKRTDLLIKAIEEGRLALKSAR